MKMIKPRALYLLFFLLPSLSACSQEIYADKVEDSKIAIADGYLATYRDSNIFVHKSQVNATRDSEKIYSKSFQVKLPKNIMYIRINNQDKFEFYYSNDQVVYIDTDLKNKENKIDTVYEPLVDEVYNLINFDEYSRSDTSRFLLQKIPYNKRRKTAILKRENTTILLYNILPEKYTIFIDFLRHFKFI